MNINVSWNRKIVVICTEKMKKKTQIGKYSYVTNEKKANAQKKKQKHIFVFNVFARIMTRVVLMQTWKSYSGIQQMDCFNKNGINDHKKVAYYTHMIKKK